MCHLAPHCLALLISLFLHVLCEALSSYLLFTKRFPLFIFEINFITSNNEPALLRNSNIAQDSTNWIVVQICSSWSITNYDATDVIWVNFQVKSDQMVKMWNDDSRLILIEEVRKRREVWEYKKVQFSNIFFFIILFVSLSTLSIKKKTMK